MRPVYRKALVRAVELYGEWYVAEYLHETHEQFRAWLDGLDDHVPEPVFLRLVDLILSKQTEAIRASRPSPIDAELISERPQR
jgi:hypothetical protein